MDFCEAKSLFINGQIDKGNEVLLTLEKEMQLGSMEAAYYLSRAYLFGLGVKQNEEQAIKLLRISSETFTPAMAALGYYLLKGIGIVQNNEEGLRLLKESSLNGCVISDMFLSQNKQCVDYAELQFSHFLTRKEKIEILEQIDDDMARSMLYIYETDEDKRRSISNSFKGSMYRYAHVVYLKTEIMDERWLNKDNLGLLNDLSNIGYRYATEVLGDIYAEFGDYSAAAHMYSLSFSKGMVSSGTKFVILLANGEHISNIDIDTFIATAYASSESGNSYATFILAYYYETVKKYTTAANVLLKKASSLGSFVAQGLLEVKY